MRLATAKILCGAGLILTCASAFFVAPGIDVDARREWKICEQQGALHLQGLYPQSPRCLDLDDRFKTGGALMTCGLVLIVISRPGARARQAARARGASGRWAGR